MFRRYAPGMRPAPTILAIACLLASSVALAAGRPAVVVKHDGTRLAGELLEQTERGFLVRGDSGLFLVPFGDVDHVEYGAASAPTPPAATPAPPPGAEVPAAPPDDDAGAEAPAAPAGEDAGNSAWIVVRRADGSTVAGTLVEERDGDLVIRAGADLVTVPRSDVAQVASGALEADAERPSSAPRPPAWVPTPPVARAADPVLEARLRPEFAQYEAERLQLVDGGGRWLGPRKLGYPDRQFDEADEQPFHAVVAGEPGYRLTIPEFLDLSGDAALRERYDRTIALAAARSRIGAVMLVVGASLTAAAAGSAVVSATGVDSGEGLTAAAPLALLGLPHLAGGATLLVTTDADERRLAGFDLAAVFSRRRAFGGVQRYNAHLRDRYGLPDSWKLDSL